MYIYHALINALSDHMIHINLNIIFLTHVEHSSTKTVYIKYYTKQQQQKTRLTLQTHTHTHTHTRTHARSTHARTHARTHTHTHTHTHMHRTGGQARPWKRQFRNSYWTGASWKRRQNQSGEVFEENCSKQMGHRQKTIHFSQSKSHNKHSARNARKLAAFFSSQVKANDVTEQMT